MKRWIGIGAIILIALFAVVQLFNIPTLAQQTNPPVRQEPAWDSPATRALAQRACYDCHSNEVNWPWYGKVAPVSWLVTHDVVEGREHVNFSEWDRYSEDAEEFAEVIREGEMPLPIYLPLHPEARLSAAEQQQLIDGLAATVGQSPDGERDDDDDDEHDDEEYEDDDEEYEDDDDD